MPKSLINENELAESKIIIARYGIITVNQIAKRINIKSDSVIKNEKEKLGARNVSVRKTPNTLNGEQNRKQFQI